MDARALADRLFREEHARLIAPLVRLLGGLDRAEEIVQEAFEAALVQWPREGVPDRPAAWLSRTARHKAIDRIRRAALFADKRERLARELELSREPEEEEDAGELRDDLLRLVFTCSHPALAMEAQVALALRTVCGLTTEEIARAFLVPVPTMAQRLVRAKTKIREAGIPYRVPSQEELPERLDAALASTYLVFNEGHGASAGQRLVREDLCAQALRLGALIAELLPERGEPKALLALMLLTDARRAARVSDEGELVLLADQDRARWNRAQIEQGLVLVEDALRTAGRHPYAIQAAIAALHGRAERAEDTDWAQIAALYRVLLDVAPSPVVALNGAVAIAMAGELEAGLARIDALAGELEGYHLFHSARADLLRRLGRAPDARAAYNRALALATNHVERRFLERRRRELDG